MTMLDALTTQINFGIEAFQHYIERLLKSNNQILSHFFLTPKGEQRTILNHLIYLHNKEKDLSQYIMWLLEKGADPQLDNSLAFVYECKKLDLAFLFWNEEASVRNNSQIAWDKKGITLLQRVVESEDISHLKLCIAQGVSVNQPCIKIIANKRMEVQPLHLAVIYNNPEIIDVLIKAGAQADNRCGPLLETPLMLAARFQSIAALGALLESDSRFHKLDEENTHSKWAIELLCESSFKGKNKQELLLGIAMLLCHGAAVPRDPSLQNKLVDNRKDLVEAVQHYLERRPELTVKFLRRCHDKNQSLHDIIYPKKSWSLGFKHLLGGAHCLPFTLESLVKSPQEHVHDGNDRERNEFFFAEFVKRYKKALSHRCFFNPWSPMLQNLETGAITSWEDVDTYASMHPKSRTKKIVEEMKKKYLSPSCEIQEEKTLAICSS